MDKILFELRVDCSLITSCNDYGNIGLKAGALTAGGGVKLYAGEVNTTQMKIVQRLKPQSRHFANKILVSSLPFRRSAL